MAPRETAKDEYEDGEKENGITDVQAVASYNWLDEKNPTIAVPGLPAKLSPPAEEAELAADAGFFCLDHNMFRSPDSPLEPAIRAILHLKPDFDFTSIDIVSDRWALTRLLELASEACAASGVQFVSQKRAYEPLWEFAIQVIGGTLVFIRNDDEHVTKAITRFQGFRHTFGKRYLRDTEEVATSVAHYRLTIYFPAEVGKGGGQVVVAAVAKGHPERGDATQALRVIGAGRLVPVNAILELNTIRNVAKTASLKQRVKEKTQEALLSQAGHFLLAGWTETTREADTRKKGSRHRRAVFEEKHFDFREIPPPPGHVIPAYHDLLREIIRKVSQLAAAEGARGRFIARLYRGEQAPRIISCKDSGEDIAALSDELCIRMKMSK